MDPNKSIKLGEMSKLQQKNEHDRRSLMLDKKKKKNKAKGNYGRRESGAVTAWWMSKKNPCSDRFDNKKFLSAGHQEKAMLI